MDVFAIGGANGWPLDVKSITGFTLTPPAVVNVAHFAPFAMDASSTSVTVRLNGADALTGFEYGDIQAAAFSPGVHAVDEDEGHPPEGHPPDRIPAEHLLFF